MNKIISILIILSFLFFTGCQTYYLGVRGDWLKKASLQDAGWMAVGAVASLAVHECAHMLTCELVNADYTFKQKGWGFEVAYDGDLSESDHRWICRSGLLVQNGLGLFLDDSIFSRGYHLASAGMTWTYTLRNNGSGDLYEIDKHGGKADLEWAIYSAMGAHNFFKIDW